MTRLPALFVALLACPIEAMAQDCIATAQAPDAVWSAVPVNVTGNAPLKLMTHLRCLGCKPEVSMELSAGPASPALKNMPILGPKAGIEWARAVVEDPAQREGFLQSVLRSELQSSPGCRIEGRVRGTAEIAGFGMVATDIQGECQGVGMLSGEFYSGYDGQCMYQVQLVWSPGSLALSPEGRAAAQSLFRSLRFGR